ncbi:hypothetical protein BDV96DRAFT_595518 [Lophiotrema nucula]|uniref:Uncharacterized protein n=1 Tax=Lophiotrema nucula TaxID=690887 RepID=A0A6A5ZLM7_9PLEO|nr:hypothetical protein BDV96DRAFT_595518 [Lophiotrema nucula]
MFPARPTPQDLSRPWRISFDYTPRQVLRRYWHTMQSNPEFCQDHDQLPTLTSMMEDSSLSVRQDQKMNLEDGSCSSNFGDSCASSLTHCHDLACGHTVDPGANIEGDVISKKPCGPNCTRYVFLKTSGLHMQSFSSICEVRFVCPTCIEAWIRQQFRKLNEQRSMVDGKPVAELHNTTEEEVVFWTHRLVARLIDNYFLEYHMRPAEGVSGVFRLSDVETYTYMDAPSQDIALNLNFTGRKIDYELARTAPRPCVPNPPRGRNWSYRDEAHSKTRDRSASPAADSDVSDMDINEGRSSRHQQKKPKHDKHYRYRSPIQTRGVVRKTKEQENLEKDIDQLADRLLDTKVGESKGDELMDKLMGDLGLMSVDEKQEDGDDQNSIATQGIVTPKFRGGDCTGVSDDDDEML